MTMTAESEKRLALLISLADLDGVGTKKQVLDNIAKRDYLALGSEDTQIMQSRSELVWRNDLAFTRKHLVTEGYMDGSRRDQWKLTDAGWCYLHSLCDQAVASHSGRFHQLTNNAVERIQKISKLYEYDIKLKKIMKIVKDDLGYIHDEEGRFEGGKTERYTIRYERDAKLRAEAIAIHGMRCRVCGFDFEEVYGAHGNGFIEVHHLRPVSQLSAETRIDPKIDMAVVCANCHRMLHRKKDGVLSLEELKSAIRKPTW